MRAFAEWHGSAFWPSRGWQAEDPDDVRAVIFTARRSVIDPRTGDWTQMTGEQLCEQLIAERRISAEQAHHAKQLVARDPLALDLLAQLGSERPWRTADGRTMWLGRNLLAGVEYDAVKQL